jgi:hypothetical protein
MNRRPTWPFAVAGLSLLIAAVAVVASLVRGCGPPPPGGDPSAGEGDEYNWGGSRTVVRDGRFDGFGHLGQTAANGPGGQYRFTSPYSQLGGDFVVAFYLERPNRPRQAVGLLLLRQESPRQFAVHSSVESNPIDRPLLLLADHSFPAAGGSPFWVRYGLSKPEAEEQMSLGEMPYPLAAGRVFLIDLTAAPARVLQVNEDLAGLLPAGEPTKEELRAVRRKVEERHEAARGFWTR